MGRSSCSSSTDEERDRAIEEAMEELSKQNFGYESMLGNGTYGDVMKIYNSESRTYKAAKVIICDNVDEKEIMFWSSMDHENILPLERTILLKSKSVVFISPLLFKSFDDIISDLRFSAFPMGYRCVKKWLVDTLTGLNYMHQQNICHLDLKLDNVLVSPDGVAKVCDFSFVNNTLEPVERDDIGLPSIYRAPEMFKKKYFGHMDGTKIDSWTYGLLVFEVLTLQQLYNRLDKCRLWSRDVRPLLELMLEERVFEVLVKDSYPLHSFKPGEISEALDFIGEFLKLKPSKRATASVSLGHGFARGAETLNVNLVEILHEFESQKSVDEEEEDDLGSDDDDDKNEPVSNGLEKPEAPTACNSDVNGKGDSPCSCMSTSSGVSVKSEAESSASEAEDSTTDDKEDLRLAEVHTSASGDKKRPLKIPKLKMVIQKYRYRYRYRPITTVGSFHSRCLPELPSKGEVTVKSTPGTDSDLPSVKDDVQDTETPCVVNVNCKPLQEDDEHQEMLKKVAEPNDQLPDELSPRSQPFCETAV